MPSLPTRAPCCPTRDRKEDGSTVTKEKPEQNDDQNRNERCEFRVHAHVAQAAATGSNKPSVSRRIVRDIHPNGFKSKPSAISLSTMSRTTPPINALMAHVKNNSVRLRIMCYQCLAARS